jgi:hypothetical protein
LPSWRDTRDIAQQALGLVRSGGMYTAFPDMEENLRRDNRKIHARAASAVWRSGRPTCRRGERGSASGGLPGRPDRRGHHDEPAGHAADRDARLPATWKGRPPSYGTRECLLRPGDAGRNLVEGRTGASMPVRRGGLAASASTTRTRTSISSTRPSLPSRPAGRFGTSSL